MAQRGLQARETWLWEDGPVDEGTPGLMGLVRTSLLRKENPSQGGDSTVTASPTNRFPLLVLERAAGGVEPLELQRAQEGSSP